MPRSAHLTIAGYTLLTALRDRFWLLILAANLIFFSLSLFVGELAVGEARETRAALLAAAVRLFSALALSLFVASAVLREINDKGLELILARALPRASWYFGKLLGFALLALFIAGAGALTLALFSAPGALWLWAFSLFCELLIMVCLSLLVVISFNNITLACSAIGAFYLLARGIEAIQLISAAPIMATGSMSHRLMAIGLDAIAWLLPDLHRFTRAEWLLYGAEPGQAPRIMAETLIYCALLSAVALFDLYRKEL